MHVCAHVCVCTCVCVCSLCIKIGLLQLLPVNHQQPEVVADQLDQPEEDRNELPEQYANSSAAAAELEVEGNGELQRPRTEGGRGSEERLNTAIQESNGSSNCSQSNLVVSVRSAQCRANVFMSLSVAPHSLLPCTADSILLACNSSGLLL